MKPRVAEDIRHIFNAPNRAEADRLGSRPKQLPILDEISTIHFIG
jgi:hypothetical protein